MENMLNSMQPGPELENTAVWLDILCYHIIVFTGIHHCSLLMGAHWLYQVPSILFTTVHCYDPFWPFWNVFNANTSNNSLAKSNVSNINHWSPEAVQLQCKGGVQRMAKAECLNSDQQCFVQLHLRRLHCPKKQLLQLYCFYTQVLHIALVHRKQHYMKNCVYLC